jgi:hypothetical protein
MLEAINKKSQNVKINDYYLGSEILAVRKINKNLKEKIR